MSTFQNTQEVEEDAELRMEKVVADFQHDMMSIRTGRASINMLEPVQVDAYGSMMPLNHVATLHVPEPAMITIQPFDNSQIGLIEKAIRNSGLGLNPSNDGRLIRIPIPPLNEERRKELAKKLHGIAEDHRVAMRNVRRDANDAVKKLLKDKSISEDEDRRAHDAVQKLTDANMAKLDALSKAKEKDILEVK